ncbi:hypothetical protein BVY03_03385 [bacterium K02(2017)]|nr:hypothetical protein BVY03_03385 [bacterium K02(2017)]
MCTVIYHKEVGVLSKNRDKELPTTEEIIQTNDYIAVRTKGADYYSLGVNKHGCAFVATAVNTPEWTSAVEQGHAEEAKKISAEENKGLFYPSKIVSEMLPLVENINMWIEKLKNEDKRWRGYNIILVDKSSAVVIEMHDTNMIIRDLKSINVISNHFKDVAHGAKKYEEYQNSYDRYEYVSKYVIDAVGLEGVKDVIKPKELEQQKQIWRSGVFHTVSSSIIDFNRSVLMYSDDLNKQYIEYKLTN